MLGETSDTSSTGSGLKKKKVWNLICILWKSVKFISKLEEVFLLESIPTAYNLHKSLQEQDLSGRSLLQDQQQVSSVSEAQLRQAMRFILRAYWGFTCCTNRDPGHSTFTNPYPDWKRRYISPTNTIRTKSSHICKSSHSFMAKFEIVTSFDLFFSRSVRPSDLIALGFGDIRKIAPRRPIKVRPRIFVMQMKL